ncbi:MAG: gfo/Idh/MocA family oxidoreductase, partial [Pseudomonadota bacterium]
PVERMTAFSETLVPQKVPGRRLTPAPDFSVASLVFASGVVARLTNGLYADHDHRLRLFGDDGVLDVEDPRRDDTPVRLRRYMTLRRRRFLSPRARRLKPLGGRERIAAYRGSQSRDFCRAIADMAAAAKVGRKPYLDGHFLLHVAETTLACHRAIDPDAEAADGPAMPYRPRTRFEPLEPLA